MDNYPEQILEGKSGKHFNSQGKTSFWIHIKDTIQ